jgi:HlyD family secretion protein
VHDVLSGNPWVLGVKDGRAVQRPVKIGLHGNSQVEITDGLAAGDVAIPQSSGILTGQRVRPVRQ